MKKWATAVILALAVAAASDSQVTRSDATLAARMRSLWDAQVTWTRLYVVSALGNLPDTANAKARMLRCPVDIGRAVEAYYGRATADSFARVLRRHLLTLTRFVGATKAGDGPGIDGARQELRTDAESTAAALGGINPAWSAPSFRELLDVYLQMTDREVTLRARGDYGADIANYDDLHELGWSLADRVSSAILKQFPRHPRGGR
jgi:hypothetical protein